MGYDLHCKTMYNTEYHRKHYKENSEKIMKRKLTLGVTKIEIRLSFGLVKKHYTE